MEAKVVAICGMPGSGKGELSRIANENGIPVLSMGDMIRAEAENRGLEETPGNIGLVVVSLRGQFGEQILAERLLPSIENLSLASVPIILIEGIRGTAEADVFKNHWGDNFSLLGSSSKITFSKFCTSFIFTGSPSNSGSKKLRTLHAYL